MTLSVRRRGLLAAVVVAVPALVLYVQTLLPGLGYWDTAEFQAIGPVLGIAHPTGYPTYTLLLWLASVVLQPFGDAALRANLLSAILVASGCGVVGATATLLTRRFVVGIGIGLALALSEQVWAISRHADPHALHLFLAALLVLLLVVWSDRQRAGTRPADRVLIGAAALFGVALANHALTLLLAPGVGLFVLFTFPGILGRWKLIAACLVAVAVTTVALYLYLPIRSAMNPPLDYANPQTLEGFMYVVFGQQFTGTFHARPSIADTLRFIASYTWQQLGLLFPLAIIGFVVGAAQRTALVVMLTAWFALTWWFAIGYENADIGRYYLVPQLCVAILAGLGAGAILAAGKVVLTRLAPSARAVARVAIAALLGLALVVPPLVTVPGSVAKLDESKDTSARQWLTSLAAALPSDALVVSWWSMSTPMWYGQDVEGWRPDVQIIDDRTILDDNLGTAEQVIDSNLGKRPVFLIRYYNDYGQYRERYSLKELPGVVGEPVYEVTRPEPDTGVRRPNL